MKTFNASTATYINGYGFCFVCTSEPFESIKACTELNIILPSGRNHVVKTNGASLRISQAWGVPVRVEEIWLMLND